VSEAVPETPAAFVAVMVYVEVVADAGGEPEITPVLVVKLNPVGSAGLILKDTGELLAIIVYKVGYVVPT